MTKTLEVRLGDMHVGYLTNLDDDRTFFAFSDDYREMENRPVLTQGLLTDTGELVIEERAVNRLAPPYFSNLLPEGGMRTLIARLLDVSADRDFPLLEHLGDDHLIGAVRLLPAQSVPREPTNPEVLALALPGVQMKLSAVLTEDDALTIPVRGQGGEWIVKVASGKIPGLVENEYSMLKFAAMCGIEVPAIRLLDVSSVHGIPPTFDAQGKALAIRRFDRDGD
ncbi:MAG TPA: HipA N-terminal domain-containing protein, partial [Candidatus Baltobacteraceae bacterium]|nr:HipA N-terminal domain-containing protein [Candidatus Baltobacteraceae bacterium]